MRAPRPVLLILSGALGLQACGLEGLFLNAFAPDHELVVSRVKGSIDPRVTTVSFVKSDGVEVEALDIELQGGAFDIALPTSDYANGRVVGEAGELRLEGIVPTVPKDGTTEGVVVDVDSTTRVLVVDAWLSAKSRGIASVETKVLSAQLQNLGTAFTATAGAARRLADMTGRILGAIDVAGSVRVLNAPAFDAGFQATASTINLEWLGGKSLDYTGDGVADTSSVAFDTTLGEVARGISLDGCLDPVNIRVVFETDFNDGRLDGNCDVIQRFRWVTDKPGKSMFFVGGVHMESAIQDAAIDAMMGNTGGWVPNQIPMYDDGTNGDAVAGDNVWTITFILPRGLRVGYKYTWGTAGALWTGSEEWPGNQHILEIVDVNGDNYVVRHDNFGDEATNKDRVNLNRRGNGSVTWDTDVNGDDIPDAQERPIDLDNDCTLDEFVTPTGVGPATVDCDSAEGQ